MIALSPHCNSHGNRPPQPRQRRRLWLLPQTELMASRFRDMCKRRMAKESAAATFRRCAYVLNFQLFEGEINSVLKSM